MSRRLREILKIQDNDNKELELRKYAQELGCSLQGTYTANGNHLEQEVVDRIRDAEKDLEEQNPFELKVNLFGARIDFVKVYKWIKDKARNIPFGSSESRVTKNKNLAPWYKKTWLLTLITICVAIIFGIPGYIVLFKPQKVIITDSLKDEESEKKFSNHSSEEIKSSLFEIQEFSNKDVKVAVGDLDSSAEPEKLNFKIDPSKDIDFGGVYIRGGIFQSSVEIPVVFQNPSGNDLHITSIKYTFIPKNYIFMTNELSCSGSIQIDQIIPGNENYFTDFILIDVNTSRKWFNGLKLSVELEAKLKDGSTLKTEAVEKIVGEGGVFPRLN